LKVGSRVEVPEKGRGTVRFVGPVKFSSKDNWVGIELDSPNGNHDGAVKGVRYFRCVANHGLFVTKDKVTILKKTLLPSAAKPIKSPSKSPSPVTTPASSAPSSPRSERASQPPATKSPSATAARSPTPAAAGLDDVKKVAVENLAKAEPEKDVADGEPRSPSTPDKPPALSVTSPRSSASTPATVSTSVSSPVSVPSTPPPTESVSSPRTGSTPSAQAQALPLGIESTALLKTLEELSEFKKDAQQKLKALQKSLDDTTKEKDALAKELEKEKKERDKKIAKIQKSFEEEKEKMQNAWEEEKEELAEELANLNDSLELTTLDKELAEEKAEALEKQMEKIKLKFKLNDMGELEDEDEDDSDDDSGNRDTEKDRMRKTDEDKDEKVVLRAQVQRLTDALMKLKDLSVMEKKESEKTIKQLERENNTIPALEEKIDKLKADLKQAHEKIDNLKEQLDVALEAESMVEELSEQKIELEEQVQELQQTVEDLEMLKQVSEELEENHAEVEKQLRSALYKKEIQFLESLTKIKNQQSEIEDLEKTMEQFRQKVNSLQQHVKQYEEKEENLSSEARQLSTKSQALIDQNIQLKSQMTKVAAMALERELFRLDVLQARKQLLFIQSFLPEKILSADNDSLLLLLTIDRMVFKAKLIMGHLQSYYKLDQLSFNLINDVEVQYEYEELLFAWELYWGASKVRYYLSSLRKMLNNPSVCPPEVFARVGQATLDLLPYETTMDGLLQLIKREELNQTHDISIFRSFREKMGKIVDQHILGERMELCDSFGVLPIAGSKPTRFTGVAALCPPEWKSLRHEVDGILFVENSFLLLYSQLRWFLKGGPVANQAPADTSFHLASPIRFVRDSIEVCRKLQKHLAERPSLPRHYASKLERNMFACFKTLFNITEVLRQLFAHLQATVTGQDLAGKEKEMRSILPRLASQIINESKSVTEEEMKEIDEGDRSDAPSDADAPSGAENGQPQQMENGSSTATENEQANQEEREQNGTEEKGSEWEWLSVLLGETYTSILGVSDKIINSSNFIKSDVSINITPLSAPTGVSAVSPLSGKLPHSSRTPTPSTPGTRPSEIKPGWKQRAEAVRTELLAAASVRQKLSDAEELAQERLSKLSQMESEIKEHISRYNVLQLHFTTLQKKEAELNEQLEKLSTENETQRKDHEAAQDEMVKENQELKQNIRNLKAEILELENAKQEVEQQQAELPSLEIVSAEIKALKRAVLLLRRRNSELLAWEGQKRLREMLPPISDIEATCYRMVPLRQQLQQDHDSEEDARKKGATILNLNKQNAEIQQFLNRVHSVKSESRIIDLTRTGLETPNQQWANKQLSAARLKARSKAMKERLSTVMLNAAAPTMTTGDFAVFPRGAKVSGAHPQLVGKLALPSADEGDRNDIRGQMQDLLSRLKESLTTRVTLAPHQLHRVHSLVLA